MDQITVRPSYYRRKARLAFASGKPRDSHGLNPMSSAAATFQLRYDRLAKVQAVTRQSYSMPHPHERIDVQQGAA